MEIPTMPLLPMLDKATPGDGALGNDVAEARAPFKLSQLDLGSIPKKSGGNKRAAAEVVAALDDEEDPREEAQMIQLLQQMQKVKRSKENKRRKGEIAAKAKAVTSGVRRNASKRVEEAKSSQEKLAAAHRSSLESLRVALEEEARLAAVLLLEQRRAMKEAVDTLNEKYDEAAKVKAQAELLGDYMRKHFPVVRGHVASQMDSKLAETEEVIQAIHHRPDRTLSLITSAGGWA